MKTPFKLSLILLLSTLLISTFQNCGNFKASSSLLFKTNDIKLTSSLAKADFIWSMEGNHSSISTNEYNRIYKWIDAGSQLIPLYPPLIPNSNLLDLDHSPLKVQSSQYTSTQFTSGSSLNSLLEDSYSLASENYSAILFIDSIIFPTDGSKEIPLLSLTPLQENLAGGTIKLKLFDSGDQIKIESQQVMNDLDYSTQSILISKNLLSSGIGIAVRWSSEPNQLQISANGIMSSETIIKNGEPTPFSHEPRILQIHTSLPNSGEFKLTDLGLFKRALTDLEMREFSLGIQRNYGLGLTTPITSIDDNKSELNGTLTFDQIRPYFQKILYDKACVDCHVELNTKELLLTANSNGSPWIIPGNANDSRIIQALKHSGSAVPMPKGGGQMISTDIAIIESWINAGAK